MREREAHVVRVEVSAGELIDKLTILHIKRHRLTDERALANVRTEIAALDGARAALRVTDAPALARLEASLADVNGRLWDIEDDIRACERAGEFGARFIELARSVYRVNDERARLKRAINELLGSRLVEEKSYTNYRPES